MFGGLEKTYGETRWRFYKRRVWRKIIRRFLAKFFFGVLEETFGAFGENRSEILEIWRTLFIEIVVDDLEKLFGDFGENRLVILEIWRTLFGEIVVGDLEKSFGHFGEHRLAILEIVMEYRNSG